VTFGEQNVVVEEGIDVQHVLAQVPGKHAGVVDSIAAPNDGEQLASRGLVMAKLNFRKQARALVFRFRFYFFVFLGKQRPGKCGVYHNILPGNRARDVDGDCGERGCYGLRRRHDQRVAQNLQRHGNVFFWRLYTTSNMRKPSLPPTSSSL
jgi:hypothetical protein